jgi:exopolyphosphatase/guanosine-5'-triphosphate,3'-diphosphate pyrophosphatase
VGTHDDAGNVAAVDIGSNSVRLLITDASGAELERDMQITRLGQGVDQTGVLHPDAIARTTLVLARYAASMKRHGVVRARATATSAARDAKNSAAFFDAAQHALGGVRPELLTGEQEAVLTFRGATAQLPRQRGPFLVIDIGGGSTELVLGMEEPEASISIDMGCVRMTERYLHSDPPSADELAACARAVQGELPRIREAVDVSRARCVIGTGGTFTTIAALVLQLERYDRSRTHLAELSRAQVEEQLARLETANIAARRSMLAEPGRADVIVGGAVVLGTLLRELALKSVLVSEHDILDGLVMSP